MEWYNQTIQNLGEFSRNHHRWMIVAAFLPFAIGAMFLQGGTTKAQADKAPRYLQTREIRQQAAELLPDDAVEPSAELSLHLLVWSASSK